MNALLDQAAKEARQENLDLNHQVRHTGNYFSNSVETSTQEATYLTLQMPLTKPTRQIGFINTSPRDKRTFLLKQSSALEKLGPDSIEIESNNDIKRYSRRPKQLENWCLADYVSQLELQLLEKKAKQYEGKVIDLEKALEEAENDCNENDQISPGTQQGEMEDAEIGPTDTEQWSRLWEICCCQNNFSSFTQTLKWISKLCSQKLKVKAVDTVCGDLPTSVKTKLLSSLPEKQSDTANLAKEVVLATGMKYDLTANIEVTDSSQIVQHVNLN
ncbi:unnamed protein product [Mytilus coruscus]|uniref:Uncharacterized protein n=1 Tax=Mytilus coruscus TaxID=42192 RepID=A0A6J8CKK7_MYTCO|nr:unnamed protein product [Mytilus coruscus]